MAFSRRPDSDLESHAAITRSTSSVEIALGILDDDPGIRVPHHIFVASKAPWFEITDDLPQFPESSKP